MEEKFTVAVVGAGPAGLSAACVLADAGVKTIVLDRGEYPGAKNMSGGVLYGHNLSEIVPGFEELHCPVERNIVESRIFYLSDEAGFSIGYRDKAFSEERKLNAFTAGRARFDRWFAGIASQKGALVVSGTTVTGLIRDKKGKVIGLRTNRPDGDVFADAVILADGINSPLAVEAGYRPDPHPDHVALAVKETIELDPHIIDTRFNVGRENGVTTEILGSITAGMNGVGALYTNRGSISLVIGANLKHFVKTGTRPYDLMDRFKQHPMIAPLIEGGRTLEYTAHWLAEGGYRTIPNLYGNGYLIAGDSAMLFNALHREGSNLAMASGKMAALTLIHAARKHDFSKSMLSEYAVRMKRSFVMKDMKKYRGFPGFLQNTSALFNSLPDAAQFAGREMLTVDGITKKKKQKAIFRHIRKKTGLFKLALIAIRGFISVR